MLRFGAATDPGRVRPRNEDSYLAMEHLFAVADGLGGHLAGDVASRLAVQVLEQMKFGETPALKVFEDCFAIANQKIFELAKTNPAYNGMGTTLTAVYFEGNQIVLGHIGDSRAYVLREGRLIQLTEDHSVVQELFRSGGLSEAETQMHPQRHMLSRALGIETKVDVDLREIPFQLEDLLLLCTDGLYTAVAEEEICRVLRAAMHPQQAADRLVEAANNAGGRDNITVIVVENQRPSKQLLQEIELAAELNEILGREPAYF